MSEANLQVAGVRRGSLQTDITLRAQDFGSPRRRNAPEQRLMIAVLHDALDCLEKYRFATIVRERRLFQQAQRWFRAAGGEWPFSFEYICVALDLDARTVRRRLVLRAVAQRTTRTLVPLEMGTCGAGAAEELNERTCR
jgi:hypothetical protein